MGTGISKSQKFWEFHHDNQAVSVVLWHTWRGESSGYYCGYVGWTDPSKKFPEDIHFHYGGAVGVMNTSEIPDMGISVEVVGFDTAHYRDLNIGPDGELGLRPDYVAEPMIWTKSKVFQQLRQVTDEAMAQKTE